MQQITNKTTEAMKLNDFLWGKRPRHAEKVAHVQPYKDGTQLMRKKKDGTYRVDLSCSEEHHVFFMNTEWEANRRMVLNLHPRWKDPRDK